MFTQAVRVFKLIGEREFEEFSGRFGFEFSYVHAVKGWKPRFAGNKVSACAGEMSGSTRKIAERARWISVCERLRLRADDIFVFGEFQPRQNGGAVTTRRIVTGLDVAVNKGRQLSFGQCANFLRGEFAIFEQ